MTRFTRALNPAKFIGPACPAGHDSPNRPAGARPGAGVSLLGNHAPLHNPRPAPVSAGALPSRARHGPDPRFTCATLRHTGTVSATEGPPGLRQGAVTATAANAPPPGKG